MATREAEPIDPLVGLDVAGCRPQSVAGNQAMHLKAILDNFPGGISLMDENLRVVIHNRKFLELLDFPEALFGNGASFEEFLRFNASRGEYGAGDIEEQVATRMALARQRKAHVFERQRPDGRVLEVRGVPIEGGGFVTTYTDVTEQRRSEAKIAHLALHDALTDLPNRALLRERLERPVAGTRQGDGRLAVLMLDLDRFKEVNDTLGHPIGDALLKIVAQRLRSCVRDSDTVGRLGGDEFCILQSALDPAAEAATLANRVLGSISEQFELDGHHLSIGTSIGIAVAPDHGSDADQLLKNADLALYRSKSEGRGLYRFFEPAMETQVQARRTLERELRNGLVNGEFELHYQPLVNLERDQICGCEALLRWNHPERGQLAPIDFLPLAEETGLIVPIGEWVLRQACADAATWPEHVKLAINVSPAQFKCRKLLQSVVNALATSGISPQRLELEITETLMLQDGEKVFATLTQLRNLGVRIGMDDFGTGYSSLRNLRKFPFDKIKIDRSFIQDLSEANVDAVAVVRSVVGLGVSLGIVTTAEGVERKEQLDRVRAEGCTEMQGFYICRPSPAHQIAELLAHSHAAANAA
jgi:diguanylate cyclase (GGDEF)-like protein